MEEIKKIKDNIVEVVNERLFSPMYFYFIVAWLITNWKFVYVLIFSNESLFINGQQTSKIEFLTKIYQVNTPSDLWLNFVHLFFAPFIFSFAAVWWLTLASERFFKKYENYKQNKRVIQRELEYSEKVRINKMERQVKDTEFEKKEINYEDNEDFNEMIDDSQEFVTVNSIVMRPSDVLYHTDYEAYKEALKEWKDQDLTDEQKQEIIREHNEEMKAQAQMDEWKDNR